MSDSTQYAAAPPTNTLAIASLVLAGVGWFMIPVLASIAAIVTGHMARGQIKMSHGREGGDALAIIALILGYLQLVVSCVVPILVFGGVISVGSICSVCALLTDPSSFDASALIGP